VATDHLTLGGAVLAGGESRRMGSDKALLEVDGAPLVLRAVHALEAAGAAPIVVVGGDADGLSRLGLTPVADRWPGAGPLGGIITALTTLTGPCTAVLSCDLTAASPDAVASVLAALGDADVAVPVVDGREQWLHAVWRRRCLPALESAFASGIRAPRHAVGDLRVARLLDADARWFHDADRPEDLPGGVR
jgi:molybdopterin-guanine dinucleotide biosynthesis protein A